MRNSNFLLIPALLFFCCTKTVAQVIAKFSVDAVENSIAIPVYVDLDQITNEPGYMLTLREITGGENFAVAFQVEENYHRFLWWMLDKNTGKKKRVFELLKQQSPVTDKQSIHLVDEDGALTIIAQQRKVLQYRHTTHYPPKGIDTVFKRSGFIHPLWSPAGNVLTQINPKDHYHHMGIWNPWTHVLFKGKEVDFWNIGDKKGTVRFEKFIEKVEGPVFGGFKALQEHVAFNIPATGIETTALNEVWDIKVFNTGNNAWLWDFTSQLNCAATDTVTLKEYRYGGFGFRATADWNNQNSKVLTSEGKTRKDADATTARWCMIDGDMQQGHSGILFMDHPANYNAPEPMRVWPEDTNGRGDVFFSFSPTRNTDWVLIPGKNYVLKYRMLVFDGTITQQQAEETWKNFAYMPAIHVEKE